jgi:hypothetical protein
MKKYPSMNVFKRRQRGSIAVEFAFVLFPLLLMLSGIIEFGRAFWHANVLNKVTRDAARVLSEREFLNWGEQEKRKFINEVMLYANISSLNPPLEATEVEVECGYGDSGSAFTFVPCSSLGKPVNVRVRIVEYSITLGHWMPFIGLNGRFSPATVRLSPSSTMPYLRT